MPDLPGWNSLEQVSRFHGWAEFAGIVALAFLVVFEALAYWYGHRKDDLISVQHDREMAQLNQRAADTSASAAAANERAATLEKEAATLRWQLDQEIQKRAPRLLTDQQKAILTAELRGKISKVTFVVQRDLEAKAFEIQFMGAFQDAGIALSHVDMPPGEQLFVPNGVLMYSPRVRAGTTEELEGDPLYAALQKAKLFGGTATQPLIATGFPYGLPSGPRLHADEYIVYIGQKSPY